MRSEGVGDGKGVGVGEGVWAMVGSDSLEAAKPATPRAGKTLTNERRSRPCFGSRLLDSVFPVCVFFVFTKAPFEDLFAVSQRIIVPVPTPCMLSFPYLSFTTLAFPNR